MQLKEGCAEACPGCSHRHLTMKDSLDQKEKWLKKVLSPWENLFKPIHTPDEDARWNYRGKVCLNTRFFNQKWEFGMFRRDDFIDIPSCPVHTQKVLSTINLLKKILPPADQFPMAFFYHAHAQVTLVLKTKQFPGTDWITENVKQQLNNIGIEGLALHLHPSAGRRLFDKFGWHQVYGRNFSFDSQNLIYGITSFHQLISSLYHQSLDLAETFFRTFKPMPVIDLYCGRGVSLTRWEQNNSPAIGIETSAEAVTCARINAPESTILQGTCERRLPQLEAWRQKRIEEGNSSFFLYTNPPRTGMEPLVTDWIINNLKPEKIAYLSCSAGTLKKDLLKLTEQGYEVISITPFDFFPQTYHVECLVLLKKVNNV